MQAAMWESNQWLSCDVILCFHHPDLYQRPLINYYTISTCMDLLHNHGSFWRSQNRSQCLNLYKRPPLLKDHFNVKHQHELWCFVFFLAVIRDLNRLYDADQSMCSSMRLIQASVDIKTHVCISILFTQDITLQPTVCLCYSSL